jgi:hypothetical protein
MLTVEQAKPVGNTPPAATHARRATPKDRWAAGKALRAVDVWFSKMHS